MGAYRSWFSVYYRKLFGSLALVYNGVWGLVWK